MGRTRESAATDAREMIELFRARSDAAFRGWNTRREREMAAEAEEEFEPGSEWIVEEPIDTVGGSTYRKSRLFLPPPKIVQEPKRRRRPRPPEGKRRKLYSWSFLDRESRNYSGVALTRLDSSAMYDLARHIVRHE